MKSRPSVTTEPPSPLLAQCTVHVYIPNRFQWCWNEGIVQPNRVGYRSTCTERLSVQYMCTFQTGFNDAEMRDYMYGMWILRYPYWSTQCKAGLSLVDMLRGICGRSLLRHCSRNISEAWLSWIWEAAVHVMGHRIFRFAILTKNSVWRIGMEKIFYGNI